MTQFPVPARGRLRGNSKASAGGNPFGEPDESSTDTRMSKSIMSPQRDPGTRTDVIPPPTYRRQPATYTLSFPRPPFVIPAQGGL